MHDTAYDIGQRFFATYFDGRAITVLDVGSQDVNGSLRSCAPPNSRYVGVDLAPGLGVDVVLEYPHVLPFPDGMFDAVVSTSCFEHDPLFWLTFIEMLRVSRDGSLIYINAPSNGEYHRYPTDNWRFYPDAALALLDWARFRGLEAELMESFIAGRRQDQWNDCIMVFRKGAKGGGARDRIIDALPNAYNIRKYAGAPLENPMKLPEDVLMLRDALARLRLGEEKITRLEAELSSLKAAAEAFRSRWVGFDC